MDFRNLDVCGFDAAIRGMRNSYASWDKSDSREAGKFLYIGENDMALMKRLYKAGGSERKFMRVIQVWCDIYAPLTWWKQFDTYKVATTELSTSTMHSITNKEFDVTDFEYHRFADEHILETIDYLNKSRERYLKCEDPKYKQMYWRTIIDNLPESYIQMRTVNFNYETAAHIIVDRQNHKLLEWHDFCKYMLIKLPYLKEIMDVQKDLTRGA